MILDKRFMNFDGKIGTRRIIILKKKEIAEKWEQLLCRAA
jgi:hypothetical protein